MPKAVKRVLLIILAIVLVLILVVAGYLIYFVTASYRLDDNISLEVRKTPATQTILEDTEGGPQTGVPYALVSYNIGFGAYSDDYSFFMDGGTESVARSPLAVTENISGAMDEIEKLNPDFVFIQEVDIDGTRSHHINEQDLIDRLLPYYPYGVFAQNYDSAFIMYPLTSPHGANKAGIYTLSKFEISSALRRSLPLEENLLSLVDLDRCYSISRLPMENGKELVLFNLHLSAYTSDGVIANDQLKMLMDDMLAELEQGNWAIAGGDFNKDLLGDSATIFGVGGDDYAWAQPIPEGLVPDELSIIAPYDEATNVASCRNADHPYDENSFRVTVDGFIVTQNVEVVSSSVIDTGYKYSDHNPVLLKFELR